jgi:hypothetical protein
MSQHPEERSKKTDGKPNSQTGGKNDSGKVNDVKSGSASSKSSKK